ncbi:MAG: Ig-like domain-containing protein, partial [Paludibacteraceae bacterium]|nr:Ig-like domain-containing protein [Paludibacteraceae bacterium]
MILKDNFISFKTFEFIKKYVNLWSSVNLIYAIMKIKVIILGLLITLLIGCKADEPVPVSIDQMIFDEFSTTLNEGESINLFQYLIITPESVGDTVTVNWMSSDESIATVSDYGQVNALKNGNVIITASAMGKSAEVKLLIKEVIIEEFTIPATLEVYVGEKIKFPINDLKPKNAPLYRFEWEVDGDGKIPTYSEGKWYLKADKEREYT